MMDLDIVTIGSAVLDVLMRSEEFSIASVHDQLMVCEIYGGKMNVDDAYIASGGAATNVAVGLAKRGFEVGVISELGVDLPAQIIWDDLEREKVNTGFLIQEEKERTGVSTVLVAKDGSRSAITFRGASYQLEAKDIQFGRLQDLQAIHLSSIGNSELILEIMEHCRRHNVFLSWNPSRADAEEVLLRRNSKIMADVLYLNDQEWRAVEKVKEKIFSGTKRLIVTRGKEGGDIYENAQMRHYTPQVVDNVVDETGAGDAFACAVSASLIQGRNIDDAIESGKANAASVIQHMGAKQGLLKD